MRRPNRKADRWVSLVDGQVSALMEHFDSVQIIVTKHDSDGSFLISRGGGNYYSRIGSVGEWLDAQHADPCEEDD